MSCNRTPDILAEHLALEDPALPDRKSRHDALAGHLHDCAECRDALSSLTRVEREMARWPEQAVPDWDRQQPRAAESPSTVSGRSAWRSWQWAPLAASVVLAVAVLFNVQIEFADRGLHLQFGGDAQGVAAVVDEQRLQGALAQMAAEQQSQRSRELDRLLADFADQQRREREELVRLAVSELADSTSESFEQLVDWVEYQRRTDLQLLEAGFREMMEREQEAVQSMQRLASYVQLQSVQR